MFGVCGVVGDDDDFAGSGDHVDVNGSEDAFFCELNVGVAGSDEFVNAGYGVGAIGECGDGLCAKYFVDFAYSKVMGGGEDGGVYGTVCLRRRGDAEVRDACDLRGDGGHEQGGE